ncbi:MAG: hypothetical protein AMXMBFR83_13170 [Phycisphaerae bacterium]
MPDGAMNRRRWPAVFVLAALARPSYGDWKSDVGYTALRARLQEATPTGANVAVTQVEAAASGGAYLPDRTNPQFAGKTIQSRSGESGASSHATTVAAYWYGLTESLAPAVNQIDAWAATAWLQEALNFPAGVPIAETRRVQNHSWVGTWQSSTYDTLTLRRVDLLVERDGVVVVAGVNNGAGSAIPRLIAHAYNVLSVGLTSGASSYGPTVLEMAGRVKPDLVAPAGQTSWAAPMVASASALLLESADSAGILPEMSANQRRAAEAVLVKSCLMAGATKDEFVDWRRGFASPSADGSVPLDYRYGAGELNVDNSHRILTAGRQPASTAARVALTGWDYESVGAGASRSYYFDVPEFHYLQQLSILVAWNRHVAVSYAGGPVFNPSLANIDMHLYRSDGWALGPLVDRSVSALDNVEHIYLRHLPAGGYVFRITSDATASYAVAWDARVSAAVGVDINGDGRVNGTELEAFTACAAGPGIAPLPGCAFWDTDRDGDVDQSDFGKLQACFGDKPDGSPMGCGS